MIAYKVISRIVCSCCECNTSPAVVNGGPTDGAWRRQWKRNPCRIIQEAEASIGAYSGTKERGEAREEGSGLAGLGTKGPRT